MCIVSEGVEPDSADVVGELLAVGVDAGFEVAFDGGEVDGVFDDFEVVGEVEGDGVDGLDEGAGEGVALDVLQNTIAEAGRVSAHPQSPVPLPIVTQSLHPQSVLFPGTTPLPAPMRSCLLRLRLASLLTLFLHQGHRVESEAWRQHSVESHEAGGSQQLSHEVAMGVGHFTPLPGPGIRRESWAKARRDREGLGKGEIGYLGPLGCGGFPTFTLGVGGNQAE